MMVPAGERYDAIVIGSGMGGLAAGALLARLRGWRIAVLERRPDPGGFLHGFSREVEGRRAPPPRASVERGTMDGAGPPGREGAALHRACAPGPAELAPGRATDPLRFTWDVGLHYVGGLEPGSATRGLMDLVTEKHADWAPLTDPLERLVFPDLELDLPAGPAALRARLHDAFPRAKKTVDRCLGHLRRASTWLGAHAAGLDLPGPLALLAWGIDRLDEGFSNRTVAAWLDAEVADPRLKGVLGSRWLDWGLPPEHAALGIHAMVWTHFLEGASVPVGGAGRIVEGARRVIEGPGGHVVTGCEVTRILHEDGRATGVEARISEPGGARGARFSAPVVVSDAGARRTLGQLLDTPASRALAARAADLGPTPSAILLFVGLDRPARELGLGGENLWLHDQWSHAALWRERTSVLDGHPPHVFASFTSTNDPLSEGREGTLMAPMDVETFRDLPIDAGVADRARAGLLRALDRAVPGFADAVIHAELAGPTTVERFAGHPGGAIYGLPPTPARLSAGPFGPRTDVEGVALAGADAATPGVLGALVGGALAASAVPGGPSLREILDAAQRS
jgi:phytoene dehydrogenase-like protein